MNDSLDMRSTSYGMQYVVQRNVESKHFPIHASFFLLGFMFPPLWCIAWLCWPKSDNRYEMFWLKFNRVMSIIFILVVLIALWENLQFNHHANGNLLQSIFSFFLSVVF
ncbi:hypothetical protein BY458DRAFT_526120 [Sporodiniella umbellata]|nr:hypothetical protein BY458DRAFT_526120 [Sporodiniella umbellata]